MSSRVRSAPFLSICALARMTMPGMQKPHCRRAARGERVGEPRRARPRSTPSSVVIALPAAFSSDSWQLTTALPSTSTVQQPHWPDGEQPSLGEVMSSSSRSAASRCGMVGRAPRTGAPLSGRTVVTVVVDGGHGRRPVRAAARRAG